MSEIGEFFSAKPQPTITAEDKQKSKYIRKFFNKEEKKKGYDWMRNKLWKLRIVKDLYWSYFDYKLNKLERKEQVKIARGHKPTPREELLKDLKQDVIERTLDFNYFEEWADTIILNPDNYDKDSIDEVIRVDTKQKFKRSIFDITQRRTELLYDYWFKQLKKDTRKNRKPIIEQLEEEDIINVDIFKNLLKQGQLDIKDIPTTLEPEIEELEEEEEIEPLVIPNKLVQQIEGYTGKQKGKKRSEELKFTEADQLRLDTIKDRVVKKVLEFKKAVAEYDEMLIPTTNEDILDRLNKLEQERKAKKTNAKYKKNFEERIFEYIKLWINDNATKIYDDDLDYGKTLSNSQLIEWIKSRGDTTKKERKVVKEYQKKKFENVSFLYDSKEDKYGFYNYSSDIFDYNERPLNLIRNEIMTSNETTNTRFKGAMFYKLNNPPYKQLDTANDDIYSFDTIEEEGDMRDNLYYEREVFRNNKEYNFNPFIRVKFEEKNMDIKTSLHQYYIVNPNRLGLHIEEVLMNIPVIRVDKKSTDVPNEFNYDFTVWGFIYFRPIRGKLTNTWLFNLNSNRINFFNEVIKPIGGEYEYYDSEFVKSINEEGRDYEGQEVSGYPNYLIFLCNFTTKTYHTYKEYTVRKKISDDYYETDDEGNFVDYVYREEDVKELVKTEQIDVWDIEFRLLNYFNDKLDKFLDIWKELDLNYQKIINKKTNNWQFVFTNFDVDYFPKILLFSNKKLFDKYESDYKEGELEKDEEFIDERYEGQTTLDNIKPWSDIDMRRAKGRVIWKKK